jgi:hypothetical protein
VNGTPLPPATPFPPGSRYSGIATATIQAPGAEPVIYLRRRFVPQPESLVLLVQHLVTQEERLDNVAAATLGDPEQFWRICDANRAMIPEDLVAVPGRYLRITLPQGIPAAGGLPGA